MNELLSRVLGRLGSDFGTNVAVRDEILTGKSGAFVLLVDCEGTHNGLFVLKIGRRPTSWEPEPVAHARAVADRAFGGSVPQVIRSFDEGDSYVLLLELAGGSRITWMPLTAAPALLASGYKALADALWTPTLFSIEPLLPASVIASRALGYRIEPGHGGRIVEHASAAIGERAAKAAQVAHLGRIFVNPLHFATAHDAYTGVEIRRIVSPIHGDCHSGNIFITTDRSGQVADLRLIDLASYDRNGVFFFDHAYFELSTLLKQLSGIGERRWLKIADAMSNLHPDASELDHLERAWVEDLLDGRQTAIDTSLRGEQFKNRHDDLRLQLLLANVIAGLSFMNKVAREKSGSTGLTDENYRQCFIWAAVHLEEFLRETRTPFPSHSDDIPVVSWGQTQPRTITEKTWALFNNFDESGLNVLVLDGETRTRHAAELPALLSLPWHLVCDFASTDFDDALLGVGVRQYRQHWPGSKRPELAVLARGGIWFFANGRRDLSDAPPSVTATDWRRRYYRVLQDLFMDVSEHLAPSEVRALIVAETLDVATTRLAVEALDTAFGDRLIPPLLLGAPPSYVSDAVATIPSTFSDALQYIVDTRAPVPPGAATVDLLPRRTAEQVSLQPPPADLLRRIERDVTVVCRSKASTFPFGRVFARDFRRGMAIEWSELAQNLDVTRALYTDLKGQIGQALGASTNATVNLLHEPSAGGSTLARRLAWNTMEEYPVVLLNQVSGDTASYLRDLFQWCRLPILVVMESEVVTESERESLLQQLREDNTRAVFLWVSRVYEHDDHDVLTSQLSPAEVEEFFAAYFSEVTDETRRAQISRLARDPELSEQRSPFFFGLLAFGEDFVGLDRLVEDTIHRVATKGREPLASIALVSLYAAAGFPRAEFEEIVDGLPGFPLRSPFAVYANEYVKIPHVLIAQRTLIALAREPHVWKADLHRFASWLLDRLAHLTNRRSERVLRLVENVFLTRDLVKALQVDTDAESGGLAHQGRFSPLIRDIGNIDQARALLSRLVSLWPDQPHHAVHYARHLLYESPREIERATNVAQAAEKLQPADDDTVAHMVGMCYRFEMEALLRDALERHLSFDDVAPRVQTAYLAATGKFEQAVLISRASSEYGHVACIQTCSTLLLRAKELSKRKTLGEFLAVPAYRWCATALTVAEQHIEALKAMPKRQLSVRARRTVAEWDLVYGNIDLVVTNLRMIAREHEDPDIRRALCRALVAKHKRKWALIPQSDLQTLAMLMERNIEGQGVRDPDVRSWLNAYRHLTSFSLDVAVSRLSDWQQLRPQAMEPAFFLYVFYFLRWINSTPRNEGYARQVIHWLGVCIKNRELGHRAWGYEWLKGDEHSGYSTVHFTELDFDPVALIRGVSSQSRKRLSELGRITGVVTKYRGPQQATLDLGHYVTLRFTPLEKITRDDEGKRATVFASFGYDGIVGWDPALMHEERQLRTV